MKFNSKVFGLAFFCATISYSGYAQDIESRDINPVEQSIVHGYDQASKTYTFEVETDYKLMKTEDGETTVLMKGTGSQVYLLNIEPGTYWMFKTDANGQNILDKFEVK